ncbi:MAG TPA: M28 family metallopeptidase [Actinomycetota bacterium]|jgi:Zn-dependent M28 family amino/carboxypeptidase|nr:M28 family metallopeptidase [Actinomycetota bacterium]
MRRLAIGAVALLTALLMATPAQAVDEVNTKRLRNAVTVNGILAHERVFQRIANQNGGTRASGLPGYDASVAYVAGRLEAAGYEVTLQPFTFPFFQELSSALQQVSPTATDYETGAFTFSGSGEVEGVVVPIDLVIPATPEPSSSSGCEASDFPAPPAGPAIALIQRGTCTFEDKAANAQAAGYDAVIIFNEGNPGRTDLFIGTLGRPFEGLPVVGLSYEDAVAINEQLADGPVTMRVATETVIDLERETVNVLADSPTGSDDRVVVVGAHLDSVPAGPGINDNGSGSSTILEIAEEMAELGIRNRQKLRFAFWGAEEPGLFGSEHYVESLSDAELGTIYANLNFDMVGSPNYVRFVYDGDGSDTPTAGPPGSAQIEAIFNNYFAGQDLASEPTAFDGRSDYGPFIAVGIPAGGLFTGAEGIKTPEQAAVYGGTAGVAYDPCYHQACDTINNLSTKALSEMGDAAAHAVMTLARTRTGFFEDGSRVGRARVATAERGPQAAA